MNKQFKKRTISVALSAIAAYMGATSAAAQEEATQGFELASQFTLGVQSVDDSGDSDNMQRFTDGLEDTVVIESLRVDGSDDTKYLSLVGRDVGQEDQSLLLESGVYGKLNLELSWDEAIRNYSDGVFLGTRVAKDYWSIADSTQAALQAGFTPLNANPTAAGQAMLNDLLANAQKAELEAQRETGRIAATFNALPGLDVRVEYSHEDKDGQRAVSSGSYRRSATGATAVGGIGESFRTYGQEFPMPTQFQTDRAGLGADFRRDAWFVDLQYWYTKFEDQIDSLSYDNPLLLQGQNGQVGGSPIHRMDLVPDYDSNSFSLTGGVTDLPWRSRLTATYSHDQVEQDDNFLPFTINPALRDDSGVPATTLPLPQSSLNGEVTTELLNVVLSSRPLRPLAVNLRYNRYDYDNESDQITWTGWAGIGESTWKDYDGSVAAQQPYRNRVPEYTRTRASADATWNFASFARLKGEYTNEQWDRNADRYADNEEDIYRLVLTVLPTDWSSVELEYRTGDRSIEGEYAAHLRNGVQEEWEELRMYDQAERDRDELKLDVSLDFTEGLSLGFSVANYEDNFEEHYYGLHEVEGYFANVDATISLSDRVDILLYYGLDEVESKQLNRTKSDKTGGGSFAIPQNDWKTDLTDDTDSYGLQMTAALIPDKLSLRLAADMTQSSGEIDTKNTDYVAGITVTGATAYPWPDVNVDTTELVAALEYTYTPQLKFGLRYTYLDQDIDDFAIDNARLYYGTSPDAQGNVQTHSVYMNALPRSYDANVLMVTMSYDF